MKRNYFISLFLSAVFAMAFTCSAYAADSMTDLLGTWKFTCTMEVTDAGTAAGIEDLFSTETEVTIETSSIYEAKITGIGNASYTLNVSNFEDNTFYCLNVYGSCWGTYFIMVTKDLVNPWYDSSNAARLNFTVSDDDQTITMDDFQMGQISSYDDESAVLLATITDAKLTLVESETIEVNDLTGDWHVTNAGGTYSSVSDSEIDTEYDFTLTATSEDYTTYDVVLTFPDYGSFTTTATFDGNLLKIAIDNIVLDADSGIYLSDYYYAIEGTYFSFNYASESTLGAYDGVRILQITDDGKTTLQYWIDGKASKVDNSIDFTGQYTISGQYLDMETSEYVDYSFIMTVTYNETYDLYYITQFGDYDTYSMNYGGISGTQTDNTVAFSLAMNYLDLDRTDGYLYTRIYDADGTQSGTIDLSYDSSTDTYSMSDFCIGTQVMNSTTYELEDMEIIQYYTDPVVTIYSEEGDFAQTFTLSGTYEDLLTNEYVDYSFDMTITYNESTEKYYLTEFNGVDVYSKNYGSISGTVEDNVLTLSIASRNYASSYWLSDDGDYMYSCLYDANGGQSEGIVISYSDGEYSISDFYYGTYNWSQSTLVELTQYYTNVSIAPKVYNYAEVTEGSYTLTGKCKDLLTEEVTDVECEFTLSYSDYTSRYYVTNILGSSITSANAGGLPSDLDEDDSSSLTINLTSTYGKGFWKRVDNDSIEYYYYIFLDSNLESGTLLFKGQDDGETYALDDFYVAPYDYSTGTIYDAIYYYYDLTAVAGYEEDETTGIVGASSSSDAPSIKVVGSEIKLGSATQVEVYSISGAKEFSGVTSSVSGLASGLHIVKAAGSVVKVIVK